MLLTLKNESRDKMYLKFAIPTRNGALFIFRDMWGLFVCLASVCCYCFLSS